MSILFDFLKSSCARCGMDKGKLYKINETDWLCLDCLKEGEYKASWADIKTRISETYDFLKKDDDEIFEELMSEADEILKLRIMLDEGKITKEEYERESKDFFESGL